MSDRTPYATFTTTDGKKIHAYVSERRRYGGKGGATYTWIEFKEEGEEGLLPYADPWPCINPPVSGLKFELRGRYDIPLTAVDFRWAKKMISEKRIFLCSEADHTLLMK